MFDGKTAERLPEEPAIDPELLLRRATLACATRGVCAAYLDALAHGAGTDTGEGDAHAFAQVLFADYGEAAVAFITAWQQGAGIDENIYTVEIAAKGFARIPDIDTRICDMIEDLLLGFVHDCLVPATVRLLRQADR
jgi:hypothetical protein